MENVVTSGKSTCTCKDAAIDVAAVGAPGAKKVKKKKKAARFKNNEKDAVVEEIVMISLPLYNVHTHLPSPVVGCILLADV